MLWGTSVLAQHLPIISDVKASPRIGFTGFFGLGTTAFQFEATYKDMDGDPFRTFDLVLTTGSREQVYPAQSRAGDPRRGISQTWIVPLLRQGTYRVSFSAQDKDGAATGPAELRVTVLHWGLTAVPMAAVFWLLASGIALLFTSLGMRELWACALAWLAAWVLPPVLLYIVGSRLGAFNILVLGYMAGTIVVVTLALGFLAWLWQRSGVRGPEAQREE